VALPSISEGPQAEDTIMTTLQTVSTPPRRPEFPSILKRSVVIAGKKTSISLESDFWDHARNLARASNMTISQYISDISARARGTNLSSAIRVQVLRHWCSVAASLQADR
jgi:predicted DNA-binding ribbon-helix-helix protein